MTTPKKKRNLQPAIALLRREGNAKITSSLSVDGEGRVVDTPLYQEGEALVLASNLLLRMLDLANECAPIVATWEVES